MHLEAKPFKDHMENLAPVAGDPSWISPKMQVPKLQKHIEQENAIVLRTLPGTGISHNSIESAADMGNLKVPIKRGKNKKWHREKLREAAPAKRDADLASAANGLGEAQRRLPL
eukprot:10021317-Prorocentrum_lima.AAC.1